MGTALATQAVCELMPYCTNCGSTVGKTHRYCGQCGDPLTDGINDEYEGLPPSGTASGREGFLSGRSLEYLVDVFNGDEEWDRESQGYAHISRDVMNGLNDFFYLTRVKEFNLFLVVIEKLHDGKSLSKVPEDMSSAELDRYLMLRGFFRLPRLYDQTFDTEWEDELYEQFTDFIEDIKQDMADGG